VRDLFSTGSIPLGLGLSLRRMRLERELACDALVCERPQTRNLGPTGETILKLLGANHLQRTPLSPVVGILEEKRSAASASSKSHEFKSRKIGFISPWPLGVLMVLAIIGLSNAQTEKRDPLIKSQPESPTHRPLQKIRNPQHKRPRELMRSAGNLRNNKRLSKTCRKQVDDLRVQLRISDTADSSSDSETLRNLERDYSQARTRVTHFQKIYDALKAKSRAELRKVIPTAAPDAAMDRYLADLAKVEQQYAGNITDLGPQHPEIQKLKEMKKTINEQIEDRIDGVLAGIELQVGQAQAVVDELEKRLAASRAQADARKSKEYEEYFRIKRSLENEQRKKDELYLRMLQEKIDSKVAPEKADQPQASTENSVNASIAVNDARLLMEMGKLDEAEAKLKQVVQDDPQHRAALYYLKLIKERRFSAESRRREFDDTTIATGGPAAPEAWSLFPPGRKSKTNPYAPPTYTSAGRNKLVQKLEKIVLPEWRVQEGTALSEILKNLQRDTKKERS
jgi:tetratricopeptide (TPR) repeat protein